MVNRSIEQKILKMKRRNRYARFSGATSKTVTKVVERIEPEGEDKVRVKHVEVYVGLVSLSKQVPKGKGPNQERMVQYYNTVKPSSFEKRTLADILGLVKDPRYAKIWWETPACNRVNLYEDSSGRLDLFFCGSQWFLVDIDFKNKIIRRSRDHGSKAMVMHRLTSRTVEWVEQFPIQ